MQKHILLQSTKAKRKITKMCTSLIVTCYLLGVVLVEHANINTKQLDKMNKVEEYLKWSISNSLYQSIFLISKNWHGKKDKQILSSKDILIRRNCPALTKYEINKEFVIICWFEYFTIFRFLFYCSCSFYFGNLIFSNENCLVYIIMCSVATVKLEWYHHITYQPEVLQKLSKT